MEPTIVDKMLVLVREFFLNSVYFLLNSLFFILRQVYITFGFILWKIGGGSKYFLDENKANHLWEAYKLLNPHPMSTTERATFWVDKKQCVFEKVDRYHSLTFPENNFSFFRAEPLEHQSGEFLRVDIDFEKVFLVDSKKVRRGCCGSYSMEKALYLSQTFGGDPLCGGGIKHFFPSRIRNLVETIRLKRILASNTLQVFLMVNHDGSHGHFSEKGWDTNEPKGYMAMFLGEENSVKRYLEYHQSWYPGFEQFKKIEVRFI